MLKVVFWCSGRPKNWTQVLASRSWKFWAQEWVRHQEKFESRVFPRSKRTNEMLHIAPYGTWWGDLTIIRVFLSGPQEEADVSGPLLLCEEFQVLRLYANLINIFREFIFPCSAVTRPSGPPLLLLIGNPTYFNMSDFYGLNFIHLPRPSNKEICLSPKPS